MSTLAAGLDGWLLVPLGLLALAVYFALLMAATKAGVVGAVQEMSGKLSSTRRSVDHALAGIESARTEKDIGKALSKGIGALKVGYGAVGAISSSSLDRMADELDEAAAVRLRELRST